MKKGWIIGLAIFGVIVLFAVILGAKAISVRNSIVTMDEAVKTAWGHIQSSYQRRADLIPNLVETVKGYASHEKETLEGIAQARAKMGGVVNIPAEAVNNPEMMQKYAAAQSSIGSALQRLMVVAEQYPDLKANQNFMSFQAQLEGTENRISVERRRYNETVQQYNTYIRKFPNNLMAGIMGSQRAQLFEADASAQNAPQVKF
ncbi:MAG: LemA family protein [Fibrobacteres bacterium]|nr:LemA family protein [Fibrobacterota bacterium]